MLKEVKKIMIIHKENVNHAKKDLKDNQITKWDFMDLMIEFHKSTSKLLEDIRQYEINK